MMRICSSCGTEVKEGISFCQRCGNIIGAQQRGARPSVEQQQKKIGCLTIFLWIFFFPIMIIMFVAKSQKLSKKSKVATIVALSVVFLLIGILSPKDTDSQITNTNSQQHPSLSVTSNAGDNKKDTSKTDNKTIVKEITSQEENKIREIYVGKAARLIFFALPYEVKEEDFIVVAEDLKVVDVVFDSITGVDGKKVITINVIGKTVGQTDVYIKSNDEKIFSNKVNIIVNEEVEQEQSSQEQPSEEQPSQEQSSEDTSRTVYVTPSGKKYHYDPQCGGKNSSDTTLNKAKNRGKEPCKKCVH